MPDEKWHCAPAMLFATAETDHTIVKRLGQLQCYVHANPVVKTRRFHKIATASKVYFVSEIGAAFDYTSEAVGSVAFMIVLQFAFDLAKGIFPDKTCASRSFRATNWHKLIKVAH